MSSDLASKVSEKSDNLVTFLAKFSYMHAKHFQSKSCLRRTKTVFVL